VDGKFQFSQAAVGIAANVLVSLLIAGLLSWFYLLEWDGAVVYDHNSRIPLYVLAFILITIFSSSFFSFRRSRIIAGMMKKLHAVLDDASRGIFPERDVVFRKNDYYRQLAIPLNACLKRLRAQGDDPSPAMIGELQGLVAAIEGEGMEAPDIACFVKEMIRRHEGGTDSLSTGSAVQGTGSIA
jgi:hypothetical protein